MLKKISLIVALLVASNVQAQSILNDLVGIGFESNKATVLKESFNSKIPEDARFLAGKTVSIQEATAASACSGTLTFNGTTAVVTSTTCATTGSRIFLTPTSDPTGSTAAYCWVSAISNGVSFSVDCDQANDGTANWIIFHEAP